MAEALRHVTPRHAGAEQETGTGTGTGSRWPPSGGRSTGRRTVRAEADAAPAAPTPRSPDHPAACRDHRASHRTDPLLLLLRRVKRVKRRRTALRNRNNPLGWHTHAEAGSDHRQLHGDVVDLGEPARLEPRPLAQTVDPERLPAQGIPGDHAEAFVREVGQVQCRARGQWVVAVEYNGNGR
nr:hypothetical protein [Streptomyces sp. MBT53]